MDLVWDAGGWLTPAQVRQGLDRRVAPTTVGTVLSRLHDKGRLERRKVGKSFEYRATRSREEHAAMLMEQALEASQDRPLALLQFVDRLPAGDRSLLRRMLGQ